MSYSKSDFRKGDRVELHLGTDAWMQGDRYGTVTIVGKKYLSVKMDRSGKSLKVTPSNIYEILEHRNPRPATRKNPRKRRISVTGLDRKGNLAWSDSSEKAVKRSPYNRKAPRRRYAPKGSHFEKRSKPIVKRGVMFVGRSTLVKDKPKRNPFSGHIIMGIERKGTRRWYYDGEKSFVNEKKFAERYSSHEAAYHAMHRLVKGGYVPRKLVSVEITK